jgi:membrane associated rhomboid family serine protease
VVRARRLTRRPNARRCERQPGARGVSRAFEHSSDQRARLLLLTLASGPALGLKSAMPTTSRICPACRTLNGPRENRCYGCGRRLPGPLGNWVAQLFGGEQLATRGLVVACLMVFGLAIVTDGSFPVAPELGMPGRFRVSTFARFGALFPPLFSPWQLLSAVFFHASVLHIAFNLMALVSFGRVLEQRFGSARSLLLFLLAGVGGFVVSLWWYGPFGPPTAGASGGVFGQLGGILGIAIARRDRQWKEMLIQNLVLALILALAQRVNTAAHLGGFAVGILLGFLFEREPRHQLVTQLFGALAIASAMASIAAVAVSMASPLWREIRTEELLRVSTRGVRGVQGERGAKPTTGPPVGPPELESRPVQLPSNAIA